MLLITFCQYKDFGFKGTISDRLFQTLNAILEDISAANISQQMLKSEFKQYHILVFQNYCTATLVTSLKSCTKLGRPDQSQRELTVDISY